MAEFRTAAFRTEPFTLFVIAGPVTHSFPALTAREWLEILGSRNWVAATLAMLPQEDYERFLDGVEVARFGRADVIALAHSALAQSAGRPWWEAERLTGACFNDNGRLLGTLIGNGTDPSRMTLAVFLACVWAALTKGADATDIAKLESELLPPPPEATQEERAELEDDLFGMVERMRAMPGVRTG